MYRVGKRTTHRKRLVLATGGGMVLLLVLGGWLISRDINRNTTGTNETTDTVTRTLAAQATAPKHVTEQWFSLDIPADWKETGRQTAPQRFIEWTGTTKDSSARSLRVYTDALPTTLAVNRLLPVSSLGERLSPGPVSDSCDTFTGSERMTPETARVAKPTASKWQQVNFICDLPNYARNVIGTGSTEGINKVTLTGSSSGKHSYFFVYTDHTGHPDDKTLVDIVTSFKAL